MGMVDRSTSSLFVQSSPAVPIFKTNFGGHFNLRDKTRGLKTLNKWYRFLVSTTGCRCRRTRRTQRHSPATDIMNMVDARLLFSRTSSSDLPSFE